MKVQNKQQHPNIHRRQLFHKEIRRKTLQDKFKKIRHEFIYQVGSESKLVERAQSTIQMIKHVEYYFLNVQQNISLMAKNSVQFICADMELIKDDHLVGQINQAWKLIAKWEYDNKEHFDVILRNIINSICPIIYNDTVFDFLLHLLDCLILADKVKIVKQKISPQKQLILVGTQQNVFMQGTALMCYHCLTNLTGYEYDQFVLPFLSKMSYVCKKHPKYFQIYLNIFLTKNKDIDLKYKLFCDYIQMVNQNRSSQVDNIVKHLDIIQVIYLKQPLIKKWHQMFYEINFKVMQIINNFLHNCLFKIQQQYNKKQVAEILLIKHLLKIIYALSQVLPSKVCHSDYILRFLMYRLKLSKSQSDLQNLYLTLQLFSQLAQQNFHLQYIVQDQPLFWPFMMKLIKPFASIEINRKSTTSEYIYEGSDIQKQILLQLLYLLQVIASSSKFIDRLVNEKDLLSNLLIIYFNHTGVNKKNNNGKIQGQIAAIFGLCFVQIKRSDPIFKYFLQLLIKNSGIEMFIQQMKPNKIAQQIALQFWLKLFEDHPDQNSQQLQQNINAIINRVIKEKQFMEILMNLRDNETDNQKFKKVCIILDYCEKEKNYYY